MYRLGAIFVQLPTSSFGSGVHAGHGVMDAGQLQVLRTLLNKGKFFSASYGSPILRCTKSGTWCANQGSIYGPTNAKPRHGAHERICVQESAGEELPRREVPEAIVLSIILEHVCCEKQACHTARASHPLQATEPTWNSSQQQQY